MQRARWRVRVVTWAPGYLAAERSDRIYRAHDRLKATLTAVSGWTAATAAGAAFAAYWTPADAAGPWAWAAHGVGTLIAGGIGYWLGSTVTRNIYELVVE